MVGGGYYRARCISVSTVTLRFIVTVIFVGFVTGCSGTLHVPVSDQSQTSHVPTVTSKTQTAGVHVVRRGDTLYSIAFAAGVDTRDLASWNRISSPYLIKPGQRLALRSKSTRHASDSSKTVSKSTPMRANKTSTISGKPMSSWAWPVKGKILRTFSIANGNKGVDIAASSGHPVRSTASGRVVYAGDGLRGYGNLLIIKHNQQFLSAYAHNRRLLVNEGDAVSRGQKIAEVGKSGTRKTMLHFEIRKNGSPVNPLKYLPQRG